MLLRVRYLPERGMSHPYVVPLPTWSMVGHDPVNATAVVDVPEEDIPEELTTDKERRVTITHIGPVLHGASGDAHKAWAKHLNKRYKEAPEEFTPELA